MKKTALLLVALGFVFASCSSGTTSPSNPIHNTHTFSDKWTHNSTYHWHASTCGHDVVSDKAVHTFVSEVTPPTYTTAGYTTHTCSVCSYSYVDSRVDKLVHNYSDEWSFDATSHWHNCTDEGYENLNKDRANHSYGDWITDLEPTIAEDGTKHRNCTVCGYRQDGIIYATGNAVLEFIVSGNEASAYLDYYPNTDELVIPSFTPNGEKIISIQISHLDANYSIKKLVLGENIEEVWLPALFGLEEIDIHPSNKSLIVEDEILYSRDKKTIFLVTKNIAGDLVVDNNVKTIQHYAFEKREYLTSVTLPEGLTNLGSQCFCDCIRLESIVFPNSLTEIPDAVCYGCSRLTNITLGKYVTKLNLGCFENCDSLEEIVLPSALKEIGRSAFYNDVRLERINFDNVEIIDDGAFENCDSLYIIDLSSVKIIREYAFRGCGSLCSVTISNKLELIEDEAFRCGTLVEVVNNSSFNIEAGSSDYGGIAKNALSVTTGNSKVYKQNDCLVIDVGSERYLIEYIGVDGILVIPEGVTKCLPDGGGAYDLKEKIVSVTIPSTYNDDMVRFPGGSRLVEVINHSSIDTYVPGFDSSLLRSESYVSRNGDYVFDHNHDLLAYLGKEREISLPSNVERINICAFYGNLFLEKVICNEGLLYIGTGAFSHCEYLREFTLSDSVTTLSDGSFSFTAMKEFNITKNVSSLRKYDYWSTSFQHSSLEIITVDPDNSFYKAVDGVLFTHDMTHLVYYPEMKKDEKYVIPEGVEVIDEMAFYIYWEFEMYLKEVIFPSTLLRISNFAFYYQGELTHITLPDHLTSIGSHAFYSCNKLSNIEFNNELIEIGHEAFHNTDLEEIVIPSSVTRLELDCFEYCRHLRSVTLPVSLEYFDYNVFTGCESLTEINYLGTMEQWEAIHFSENKKIAVYIQTIHCIDGDINL